MPRCPFCKGQIGEDLLRFGGHCPHCLNEIPGEETATDPGAEARQRQEAEARATAARLQRRNRVIGALMLVVLVSIPAAYLALREKPQPLILDDTELYIAPASAHQNAQADAAAAAAEAAAQKEAIRKGQPHHTGSTAAPVADQGEVATSTSGADPETAPAIPAVLPDGSINPASLNRGILGVDLTPKGPGNVGLGGLALSSDNDIKNMVRSFLKTTGQRQLTQCYESRLKENPGLSGRWNATFVIEKEGMVKSASAEGQSVHDRDLETCLVSKMEGWKFQTISHSVEIPFPLVFQGS